MQMALHPCRPRQNATAGKPGLPVFSTGKNAQRLPATRRLSLAAAPGLDFNRGFQKGGSHAGLEIPPGGAEIGRASCWERVCQEGRIVVVAVSLTQKK